VSLRITRVDLHPERGIAAVERGRRHGNDRAGERLLERAVALAPRLTGELADSGVLEHDGDEVAVGFGVEYAPVLHAHPEWNFRGGHTARWLEEAMEQEAGDVLDSWAGAIRTELGGV